MKTIIIGDVHGCADALKALLEKAEAQAEDRLVFLGDLFDRGPDSYGVFSFVKQLEREYGERFVLLRGNHEDYLMTPKLTFAQRLIWERVGKSATVRSFRAHGARMEDAIPWLKEKTRLYWKGESFQCAHAGLLIDPIEANDTQTLVHDHDAVLRNVYAGPLTVTGHIALEKATWFQGDEKTETLSCGEWRELPRSGVICIDTGAGKGGRLTCMVVSGREFRLLSVHEA